MLLSSYSDVKVSRTNVTHLTVIISYGQGRGGICQRRGGEEKSSSEKNV